MEQIIQILKDIQVILILADVLLVLILVTNGKK